MGAEKACGKSARKKHTEKVSAKKFPSPATGILVNYEGRRLGMMMKMKKMSVLNYQVTRLTHNN